MARVKTSPIPDGIEVSVAHLVGAADSGFAPVPAIPNLSHWFKSPIQAALARLTAAVETIPDPPRLRAPCDIEYYCACIKPRKRHALCCG